MYPEILGLSFLHTYGVLVALALLVALWLAEGSIVGNTACTTQKWSIAAPNPSGERQKL